MTRSRVMAIFFGFLSLALVVLMVWSAGVNANKATAEGELPPLATSTTQISPSQSPVVSSVASTSVTTSSNSPTTASSSLVVTDSKPSTTAKPAPASSSSAAPTPSIVPPAIQSVPASPPTRMTISAKPGFTVDAKVGSMDYRDDLAAPSCTGNPDPECPQKAYWIKNRLGVAPGSSCVKNPSGNNSSYLMGHSWTQDPRVFDQLSDYAMKHYDSQKVDGVVVPKITLMQSTDPGGKPLPAVETWSVSSLLGSTIGLETGTGTLTYTVTKAYIVLKSDVGRTDEFRNGTNCQLTIDTCGIDLAQHVDTNYAVILFAALTAAVPH